MLSPGTPASPPPPPSAAFPPSSSSPSSSASPSSTTTSPSSNSSRCAALRHLLPTTASRRAPRSLRAPAANVEGAVAAAPSIVFEASSAAGAAGDAAAVAADGGFGSLRPAAASFGLARMTTLGGTITAAATVTGFDDDVGTSAAAPEVPITTVAAVLAASASPPAEAASPIAFPELAPAVTSATSCAAACEASTARVSPGPSPLSALAAAVFPPPVWARLPFPDPGAAREAAAAVSRAAATASLPRTCSNLRR
ncbi:hypothetical protein Vafri_19072 [Volvox africanus]|uniref:Uncharacterized protein n=1 Tax=Volvox africanus TaxID=51714 RepID=A0A8J4BPA9_9CHLO|nr:hypothetical protein Vafri_19072 [Volvox africanus]